MQLNTKTYEFLKKLAQVWIPAFATFYFTVASIMGWPATEQVVGILAALDTLLGVLLGISTAAFNKTAAASSDGTLKIDTNNPTDIYRFEMNVPLSELGDKKIVTLVVDTTADLSPKE